MQVSPWLITIVAIIVLALIILVTERSIRAHKFKVSAGREDLIGRTAVVDVALEPRGVVLIEGERWTAVSDSGNIEPEEEVTVSRVEGLKLRVTKKEGGR